MVRGVMLLVVTCLIGMPMLSVSAQGGTSVPINISIAMMTAGQVMKAAQKSLASASAACGALGDKATTAEVLKALPNSDMFVYVLDEASAAKLGFTFVTADASSHDGIIIQEYSQYVDLPVDEGFVRCGIGVRMVVTTNEKSAKIGTLGIAGIAAEAQAHRLQATARLQVLGLSSKAITVATPIPSELTFTTLMQMYKGMDAIKQEIWSDGTKVRPQMITIPLSSNGGQ